MDEDTSYAPDSWVIKSLRTVASLQTSAESPVRLENDATVIVFLYD